MPKSPPTDWKAVKADYLAENILEDHTLSLKDLATKWSLPYKTVRNRSSLEKWNDELQECLAQKHNQVVEIIQSHEAETEAAVRIRQAHISRDLVSKGLQRFHQIQPVAGNRCLCTKVQWLFPKAVLQT